LSCNTSVNLSKRHTDVKMREGVGKVSKKWKSISEPPKKSGRYLVEFYFKNRHETERIEVAFRDFIDGKWTPPYYSHKNDGGELFAWCDKE